MKFYKNRVGLLGFLGIPAINIVDVDGSIILTHATLDRTIFNLGFTDHFDSRPGAWKEDSLMTIERAYALKRSWSKMNLPANMEAVKEIILSKKIDEELPSGYEYVPYGLDARSFVFTLPKFDFQFQEERTTRNFADLEGAIITLDGTKHVRNSSKTFWGMRKEVAVLLLQLAIRSGLPTTAEPTRLEDM